MSFHSSSSDAMDSAFFTRLEFRPPSFSFRQGSSLFNRDGSEPEPDLKSPAKPLQESAPPGMLFPQSPLMIKPDPDWDDFPMDMASLLTPSGSSSSGNNKHIPLLCTVCPETPRFSDVSHLLTHIASKGHLHHETQTKLKAHQDISASISLQQYEQWYKEHGIEGLLVERMKAKQVKEAARNKRNRGVTAVGSSKQPKKKVRRSPIDTLIKDEREGFSTDFPLFSGFLPSDNDVEVQENFFGSGDMMALKGQVWPGMGKMDLANEDMKRTRNQRKPKSVIERMRRTSEGIEPTQVVMTPKFEVERIKDVYDSSSPVPDQDEATPPEKVAKPRRKRGEPLAELSVNIPRGNRRLARGKQSQDKLQKPVLGYRRTPSSSEITPTLGKFKRSHDIFRDEDATLNGFETRSLSSSSHNEPRFDLRGRLGLHQLNPISHSNLVSPTPTSRDIPDRTFLTARELNHCRGQGQSYLGMDNHITLGSLNHSDVSYALNASSMYNHTSRLPFAASSQYNTLNNDHFRLPSNHHIQPKIENYPKPSGNESTSQFLDLPGTNPLFTQDRLFFESCNESTTTQSPTSLGFTPINCNQDLLHPPRQDHGQRQSDANNVKLESHFCDVLDNANVDDTKDSTFSMSGIWEPQASENSMEIHDDLRSEELEI